MYKRLTDVCAVGSDAVAVLGEREEQCKLTLYNLHTGNEDSVKVGLIQAIQLS